ncbi:MAG: c-type cytochrome [Solirubrobacterales bacterium]|nr:c-type cytochrome [Solirubrobacterales bacterium]
MRRRVLIVLALILAGAGTASLARAAGGGGAVPEGATAPATTARGDAAAGRQLFLSTCASCHGTDARGVSERGPSLIGAGALAADFELRTGRMPLADPGDEPLRNEPRFNDRQIRALVAYVATLGGPPIPTVAQNGSVARGRERFADSCAGCHQIMGRGGIATGAVAPSLQDATSVQVAEAIRLGPYLMPRFGPRQLDGAAVADIAAYVAYTHRPENPGGWAIGNLGPVPEGLICWGLAITLLLGVARGLGERAT